YSGPWSPSPSILSSAFCWDELGMHKDPKREHRTASDVAVLETEVEAVNQPLQPPQKQLRQPGRERAMRPQPDYRPLVSGAGRLAGKVALITGGDSGIGRAVAVAMAREGADIAIAYLEEHKD